MRDGNITETLQHCAEEAACHVCRREDIQKEMGGLLCIAGLMAEAIETLNQKNKRIEELQGLLGAMEKTAKHYKEQRDAAVKQLRRIADCDSCKYNQPCGVDGPKCVACTRGQGWEWDGGGKT